MLTIAGHSQIVFASCRELLSHYVWVVAVCQLPAVDLPTAFRFTPDPANPDSPDLFPC